MRVALLLAYDGGAYHGWQVQPGTRTIQGLLVTALGRLVGEGVKLTGASRTDAGVHALGQVATFDTPRSLAPATIQAALNANLPTDIRVLAAASVRPGLDARRSARLKRYGYLIHAGPVPLPFLRAHVWHVGRPLDAAAMGAAFRVIRGTHDFSAFCAAGGRGRPPTCTLFAVRLVRRGSLLGLVVSADAFLHHMVRNLVGTAVEVGLGRRPSASLGDVLATRDRRQAGPTAPAHGLHLLSVRYPEPLFPGGGRRVPGGLRRSVPGP